MKNWNVLAIIFCALTIYTYGQSQESKKVEEKAEIASSFGYQIDKIFPPLSHTKEELEEINTISELNRFYKKSWVKEYTSVVVTSQIDGVAQTAIGPNDILTDKQKEIIKNADLGTEVNVAVKYYPDNTLTIIEEKVYDFSFSFDPEIDAEYKGGEAQLNQYLKEKVIDHLPEGVFVGYKFASVKFHVDEQGRVVNPHIFWSSEDESVDKLLLETVCNMPVWTPASYESGKKVKQEYSFSVGNMESCAVNTLNLDKTSWAAEEDEK